MTTAEANYTLAQIIAFRQKLAQNNVNIDDCSVVFNSVVGAALLGSSNVLQAYAMGDSLAPRDGSLGRKLVGLTPYETNLLPTSSTSLVAFAAHPDSISVAMRYLAPQAPEAYLAVERVADPSGIVMGLRRSYNEAAGVHYIALECLYGMATGLTLGLVLGTKP